MNNSTAAHWFKIKESNIRSTHCRTDNTPHADRVSHPQGRIESHLLLGREVSRHHPPPGLLAPRRHPHGRQQHWIQLHCTLPFPHVAIDPIRGQVTKRQVQVDPVTPPRHADWGIGPKAQVQLRVFMDQPLCPPPTVPD